VNNKKTLVKKRQAASNMVKCSGVYRRGERFVKSTLSR